MSIQNVLLFKTGPGIIMIYGEILYVYTHYAYNLNFESYARCVPNYQVDNDTKYTYERVIILHKIYNINY